MDSRRPFSPFRRDLWMRTTLFIDLFLARIIRDLRGEKRQEENIIKLDYINITLSMGTLCFPRPAPWLWNLCVLCGERRRGWDMIVNVDELRVRLSLLLLPPASRP
jgi:hypothetical protein